MFRVRSYTGDEDFSTADAVFDCIGDKGARGMQAGRGACVGVRGRGSLTLAAFVLRAALRTCWPLLAAGSERFSLHDLTTPGAFWLTPMPPAA